MTKYDNVNNDENINSDIDNSLTISNSRVNAFVKKLFSSPSLYVKWLKALEISMRSEDDFASVNDFLNDNKCVSCTYAKVIVKELPVSELMFSSLFTLSKIIFTALS
jgi:hypothetical protein